MKEIMDDDIDKLLLQMHKELKKTEEISNRKTFPGYRLEIPQGFEEAGKKKAASVFLSKNRPDRIFINPGEHGGLTLQKADLEENSATENLEEEREKIRQILRKADSKNVFYDEGLVNGYTKAAWFDYKSFAVDERVYNMIFLFFAGTELIIGTFYCIFKDYDKWKPKILHMLEGIHAELEEEEHEGI